MRLVEYYLNIAASHTPGSFLEYDPLDGVSEIVLYYVFNVVFRGEVRSYLMLILLLKNYFIIYLFDTLAHEGM